MGLLINNLDIIDIMYYLCGHESVPETKSRQNVALSQ